MLQGVGVALKPQHVNAILESQPKLDFFEIHAENYCVAGGAFHQHLTAICQQYALSVHGVGLSLAGESPLNTAHLAALKTLIERYQPALFSEHLAWSAHGDHFYNDLLPVAYHQNNLQRISARIDAVQNYLGRCILIENPSSYLEFNTSTWGEAEFLAELVKRSGCGLLLDVNNVFVSCHNHGWNAHKYLQALPLPAVQEVHLAGFLEDPCGLYIDNHGSAVDARVWQLLASVLPALVQVPVLIEWDTHVPDWPVLLAEAEKARQLQQSFMRATPRAAHGF